ncbi:MAG: type I restriction enzyme HsdR N-terminal domain-containing protein [Nitrospiraceae bacterium]|nr:type I restriction enzyme HsdR N-terminal domain-containing protein [Nitrospiraceae bacterium]MDA8089726.1 type I restriction enzyme HsdR N-terminal domain-containing protein [Nitrospiraceae bacterium]
MDSEKEKMILEKLREQERGVVMMTGLIRERVYDFLIKEKGYLDEDIEIDAPFEIETSRQKERCSVDFIVRAGGKRIIAIKCAVSALESIERHVLAFSRAMEDGLIPVAVVTRSDYSRVLRTESGDLISEDLSAIPDRSAAMLIAAGPGCAALSPERLEKERRILLAFNVIDCGVPGACSPDSANRQKSAGHPQGTIIPLRFNR